MAKHSILDEDDTPEIDLSPMIDCIFLLLIFFIVTTVFVEERGISVTKPDAAASLSSENSEPVTIEITAEGKVLIDGKDVSLADVTSRVKAKARDAETPIVIRANGKAHHGTFVAVWDAAKRGGADKLSFTTID